MSSSMLLPASVSNLAYCGRQPGTTVRDSDTWYTPPQYIASARQVMGSIDLDPFSSDDANLIVKARYYFTAATSAFERPWRNAARKRSYPHGLNVWMNPPYSVTLLSRALQAFVQHWTAGDIAQAIVLVNNCTETQWFKAMRAASQAVCFPTSRIAFLAPDGKQVSGNTRGQVFFYYGAPEGSERFTACFATYGWTIEKARGWR